MLTQAVLLALVAGISPTALLVAALYLGSANPRLTILLYLCGALLMSLAMSIAAYLILRAGHLSRPSEHQDRYGLRLGLGLLALAAAVLVARRKAKPAGPDLPQQGRFWRLVAAPRPAAAFAAGLLLFAPGLSFLAAVQVIATADASLALSVLALAIVVTIDIICAWLPLVLYLIAPEPTTRRLRAFNTWLRLHGRQILVGGMLVVGSYLVLNGSLGLAGML